MAAVAPVHHEDRSNQGADATRILYERHRRRILGYCLSRLRDRQEAEDAVQNTFVYAFRLLNRGVVPENEQAWLFAIAHNVCRSRRRTLWRRGRIETTTDLDALQDAIGAPTSSAPEELHGLSDALAAMPETQRRALLLREWQGLSYAEIGQTLALSQSAVETLLFRARRSLANRLAPAQDKIAVMLNGLVLLRLARRLARGGLGAKTATAALALGITAGAAVPVERSLRHPPKRTPALAATRQPDHLARSAPTPPLVMHTTPAHPRHPRLATAQPPDTDEATTTNAAPNTGAPTVQSNPTGTETSSREPTKTAKPATAARSGSALDNPSALLETVTTAAQTLPAVPQPAQLVQTAVAAVSQTAATVSQTAATVSTALDLPPLVGAPVPGSTASASLPDASPSQAVSNVQDTASAATSQLVGTLPVHP